MTQKQIRRSYSNEFKPLNSPQSANETLKLFP